MSLPSEYSHLPGHSASWLGPSAAPAASAEVQYGASLGWATAPGIQHPDQPEGGTAV